MFNSISMTGTGVLGLALTYGLHKLGYDASSDSIQGLVVGILAFLSVLGTFYGQIRRQDLSMGLFRS